MGKAQADQHRATHAFFDLADGNVAMGWGESKKRGVTGGKKMGG